MNKTNDRGGSFSKIKNAFNIEHEKLNNIAESKKFFASYDRLYNACNSIPFNWKFNAIHWAFDISKICNEIAYGFSWMKAYAKVYRAKYSPGSLPSHTNFHVSYFADNCVTRIDSCRDKIALMVWAYYCPFDPRRNVLTYEDIKERLTFPVKFALNLQGRKNFLKHLTLLNNDEFKRIAKYRDMKIHRREPRIEIYGPKPHHGWPYMLPLLESKEIKQWHEKVDKQYSQMEKWPRENIIKKGCYIDGILFDQEVLKEQLWDYSFVEKLIHKCFLNILHAANGCFQILSSKKPFKKHKYKPR